MRPKTVEIEIGDDLFEVSIRDFTPARPFRWDEPPDSGELDVGTDFALKVVEDGEFLSPFRRTEWRTFLMLYAADRTAASLDRTCMETLGRPATMSELEAHAFSDLQDEVYEELLGELMDEYDDHDDE